MNIDNNNATDSVDADLQTGESLSFDLVEESFAPSESEEAEQDTEEASDEEPADESSDQEDHDEDGEDYEDEEVLDEDEEAETAEDDEDSTEDEESESEEASGESKKKPNRFQKRIDDLVSQREQEKREKQELQEKLNKLLEKEQQEAENENNTPAKQANTKDEKEPDPEALDENGLPVYPLGVMDAQYVRDLAKFTVQAEQARFAQEQEQQRHQREMDKQRAAIQQNWDDRLTTAKQEYTDFDDRGKELMEVVNQFDTKYADYLATMIMDLDNGPDVLYHLASNLDEAKEILQKGPQKATLALGHLDGKVSETRGAKKTKAKAKRVSKAPRPPSSINKGTTQSMPRVSADTDDLAAYERQYVKKRS